MIWRLTALILCLGALNLPLQAQPIPLPSTTPQDAPELLLFQTVILENVAQLYFNFVINAPVTAIQTVTLTILPEDQSVQVIPVNVAEIATIEAPFTDFSFVWTPTPNNPPPLFTDLGYLWTFTLSDGRQFTLNGTIYYADPRNTWSLETQGAITLAAPSERFSPRSNLQVLGPVYDLLSENTDQQDSFRFIVFDSVTPFDLCQRNAQDEAIVILSHQQTEVACPLETIRLIYERSGWTVISLNTPSPAMLYRAVTRAMFNRLYDRLWGDREIPAWFREGFSLFYVPTPKGAELTRSQEVLRAHGPIRNMESPPSDETERAIWEAQSYGMVQYMAGQIGVPALFELARDLATGLTLAEAYLQASDQTLASVIPQWSNWVFRPEAVNAYNYTPYLPETPTPIPSFTRTPSATRTPTPTITLTPSVTIVVAGLVEVPSTPTPTITVAASPSVTPRPMSSFFTPTPTLIALPPEQEDRQVVLVLLGLLIVGGIILIGVVGLTLRSGKQS
ncbi:MAG: hypothetical protein MUF87_11520 [Anaerolineae bacterium]|jgi:hypothetical protein|nr:hypothetical protein [Anaerolineae bacterium]